MRASIPRALLAVLALALVVRVGVIVATPDFVPIYDSEDFWRHAVSIAEGDGYPDTMIAREGPTAYRPPLYPLALAGVKLAGGGWTAGRLLGALLGVVAVFLVYVVAARLWEQRVALVAAAAAAVFPPLVLLNASLLSESVFVPLVLLVVLVTLRYRDDPRLRWAALAGVLCGLATLTRSNGPLLVGCALLGIWTMRPLARRPALIASLAVVACTAVVVVPWGVRNTMAFDRYVGLGTQQGYAAGGTYNEQSRDARRPGQPFTTQQIRAFDGLYARHDLDEAEIGERLSDSAFDFARENPGYVLEVGAWNTLRVFDVVHDFDADLMFNLLFLQATGTEEFASPVVPISIYVVVALALLGVAAEVRPRSSGRAPPFVWSAPVLLVLPAIFVWGIARYRVPVDPFLLMLAALGAVRVVERFRPRAAGA